MTANELPNPEPERLFSADALLHDMRTTRQAYEFAHLQEQAAQAQHQATIQRFLQHRVDSRGIYYHEVDALSAESVQAYRDLADAIRHQKTAEQHNNDLHTAYIGQLLVASAINPKHTPISQRVPVVNREPLTRIWHPREVKGRIASLDPKNNLMTINPVRLSTLRIRRGYYEVKLFDIAYQLTVSLTFLEG